MAARYSDADKTDERGRILRMIRRDKRVCRVALRHKGHTLLFIIALTARRR